ncbi:MAG: type II 3-dehydroquinate dehydratase [Candidatus Geothermincolales bacterium]
MLVSIANGPNLNILGWREPDIYGNESWDSVKERLVGMGEELGARLEFFQSNDEGNLVDYVQGLRGRADALIINPGALTHYGYSLRDAISALDIPVVEVHISNIYAREPWRSRSLVSPVVKAVISGFGTRGYLLALRGILEMLRDGG